MPPAFAVHKLSIDDPFHWALVWKAEMLEAGIARRAALRTFTADGMQSTYTPPEKMIFSLRLRGAQ